MTHEELVKLQPTWPATVELLHYVITDQQLCDKILRLMIQHISMAHSQGEIAGIKWAKERLSK